MSSSEMDGELLDEIEEMVTSWRKTAAAMRTDKAALTGVHAARVGGYTAALDLCALQVLQRIKEGGR